MTKEKNTLERASLLPYIYLSIRTIDREVFFGQVNRVQLPGSLGKFLVLPCHAPLVSTLVRGLVSYGDDKGVHDISIEKGIVEVLDNCVSVLVYTF